MAFVKPHRKNEWGNVSIHFGSADNPVIPAGKHKIRWEDKHEEEVEIKMATHEESFQEPHGHLRPEIIKSSIPHIPITIPHTTKAILVPLDESGCEIWQDEYNQN